MSQATTFRTMSVEFNSWGKVIWTSLIRLSFVIMNFTDIQTTGLHISTGDFGMHRIQSQNITGIENTFNVSVRVGSAQVG